MSVASTSFSKGSTCGDAGPEVDLDGLRDLTVRATLRDALKYALKQLERR